MKDRTGLANVTFEHGYETEWWYCSDGTIEAAVDPNGWNILVFELDGVIAITPPQRGICDVAQARSMGTALTYAADLAASWRMLIKNL